MKHNFEQEEERVVLKPLEKEDIETLRILRNTQIIEVENQKRWYESYLKKERDYMFKVVKKENPEEFIGAIAVYDIDYSEKSAEFGRLVIDKEKAPEKGLGYEAVKAISKFSFQVLELLTIKAFVLKNNERALKLYQKVGFSIQEETEQGYVVEMNRTDATR